MAGGLLFGLAFLMKQSGAAFVLGGALYLLLSTGGDPSTGDDQIAPWPQRLRAVALFLGGAVAPFVLACLWLLLAGTLGTFLFWSFVYGSTYSASLSASVGNFGGRFVAIAPSSSVTLTLVADRARRSSARLASIPEDPSCCSWPRRRASASRWASTFGLSTACC